MTQRNQKGRAWEEECQKRKKKKKGREKEREIERRREREKREPTDIAHYQWELTDGLRIRANYFLMLKQLFEKKKNSSKKKGKYIPLPKEAAHSVLE